MADDFLVDLSQEVAILEIAGQRVYLRGLHSLASSPTSVDLIFVLHGRTSQASAVGELASTISTHNPGGLVVTLDHRNHGHRLLSTPANETWADGNESHA